MIFTWELLYRLLAAALLGGLIGLERDIHGRAAGLRTNLLVCVGSALFMIVSEAVASIGEIEASGSIIRADPGRIAAQVITGIGFLGAGAIIKFGFSIRGLTTAACLWIVAGIGLACGAGYYLVALAVTIIALFCLIALNMVEKVYAKDSYRILEVRTSCEQEPTDIISLLQREKLKILFLDLNRDYEANTMTTRFTLRLYHRGITDKLAHTIVADLDRSEIAFQSIKWFRR
jgi:putative Mg2+ transporter-C (MgtC) family protein